MNISTLFGETEPKAEPTDVARIEQQAATEVSALVNTAHALVVSNPQQAETAADFRAQIVARRKRIEDWFAPMTDAAHKAWKALTTRRAGAIEGYAEAESIVNQKLTAFHQQERTARAAAERAAAEAARKAAEEKQLAAALAAEKRGDKQTAAKILESPPPPVPVPEVAVPVPTKLESATFTENWQFEIVDESLIPNEYKIPDVKKIRAVVKAMKGQTNIAGVRVWDAGSVRTTVRR